MATKKQELESWLNKTRLNKAGLLETLIDNAVESLDDFNDLSSEEEVNKFVESLNLKAFILRKQLKKQLLILIQNNNDNSVQAKRISIENSQVVNGETDPLAVSRNLIRDDNKDSASTDEKDADTHAVTDVEQKEKETKEQTQKLSTTTVSQSYIDTQWQVTEQQLNQNTLSIMKDESKNTQKQVDFLVLNLFYRKQIITFAKEKKLKIPEIGEDSLKSFEILFNHLIKSMKSEGYNKGTQIFESVENAQTSLLNKKDINSSYEKMKDALIEMAMEGKEESKYQCDNCEKYFDDIFYCTKCKCTKMWCRCAKCCNDLHQRKGIDHEFLPCMAYIKSGRKRVFENKQVQLIKEAYHVKLSKALERWLKDGNTEKCLKLIGKELLEFDGSKLKMAVTVGSSAAGATAAAVSEVAVRVASDAVTGGISVLPGVSYACLFAVKFGHNGWQLFKGRISVKEFWLRTGRSAIKCSAGGGLAVGGFFAGAALGSLAGGPVGTVIGGILGAVVCGILGYSGAKKGIDLWDWLTKEYPSLDESEEKQKKLLLQAAMKEFGIKNEQSDNFNKEDVSKKFKELALVWHPDRPAGCQERFQEISSYYGMLMAILETGNNEEEQEKTREMIRAITLI